MYKHRLAMMQLNASRAWERGQGMGRLSGASRYLLIRLIGLMGRAERELVQGRLSTEVGMTMRALSDSMTQLVDGQFLVPVARHVAGRGRPKSVYKVNSQYLNALAEISPPPGLNTFEGLLEAILGLTTLSDGMATSSEMTSLKPLNRLLLAALLLRADARGVASHISVAELERVCGFSGEQFKSQMSKLGSLGYVRRHVPGLSGKKLFGRARGMVFLNVGHPSFCGLGERQYVLASKGVAGAEPPKDIWELLKDSRNLPSAFADKAMQPLPFGRLGLYLSTWGFECFSSLWERDSSFGKPPYGRLDQQNRKQLVMLINAHVCDRASKIVARAWTGERAPGIKERVQKTILKFGVAERSYWEGLLRVGEGPIPDRATVAPMLALIESLAVRVMMLLNEVERERREPFGSRIIVTIVPPPYLQELAGDMDMTVARSRLGVVVVPNDSRQSQAAHHCFAMEYEGDPIERLRGVMRTFRAEQDLALEERQAAGLAYIPKRYPHPGKG